MTVQFYLISHVSSISYLSRVPNSFPVYLTDLQYVDLAILYMSYMNDWELMFPNSLFPAFAIADMVQNIKHQTLNHAYNFN